MSNVQKRIENQDEDFLKGISKKIKQFCCPIFLKEHPYDLDISETTPNATMTFVKYKNKVYGCTCKHVVESAIKLGKNGTPGALHIIAGIIIYNFNGLLLNPKNTEDFISYPEFKIPNNGTDIAIRPLSLDWFNNLNEFAQEKEFKYFDLDDYQKPDYENIEMLHAFGWLNDHKYIENRNVITELAHSTVGSVDKISENLPEFKLFSQLEKPHNYSFSGMSGGPVVHCEHDLDKVIPMGIIYEGSPTSISTNSPENESFLNSPNNILYQCHNFTPAKFAELLEDSDWNYRQDNKCKNLESWGKEPDFMVINAS